MLGLFTAISVVFAFFLSVTLLPALMILIQKFLSQTMQSFRNEKMAAPRPNAFSRALMVCARIATGRKTALFILFILILTISAAGMARIKFETNTFHYLPDTNRIKSDLLVIEEKFGGTIPFVVVIRSGKAFDFSDPEAVKRIEKFQETFFRFPYLNLS